MFRRMIQAYRHTTGRRRSLTHARWRPVLEQLEGRVVPSAASVPAHPEPPVAVPDVQVAPTIVAALQTIQFRAGPINTAMALAALPAPHNGLANEAEKTPNLTPALDSLVTQSSTLDARAFDAHAARESTPPSQVPTEDGAPEIAPRGVTARAQAELPLVAWVSGMTGLLMLRWENRKGRAVALASSQR